MEFASNRRDTELAEEFSAHVDDEAASFLHGQRSGFLSTVTSATDRFFEKVAVTTKLDTLKTSDESATVDGLVQSATVGSAAVIALSCLVLIYSWGGAALGLHSRDGATQVATSEGANPAWSPALVSGAEQSRSLAVDRAAWSPSITETASTLSEAEPAEAATPAPAPQTPLEEEKGTAIKLYDQHALHYVGGEYSKLWNAVDPACIFIDEKGKRTTVRELRPLSQQFFASIRKARVKYKIHNVMLTDDTLVAHVESELRFELRSQLLFLEDWSPHVKTEVTLDTWKKRGNVWKIAETRTLRPETLRKLTATPTAKRPSFEKTVAYPTNACGRTCAETMLQCGAAPVDPAPATPTTPATPPASKRNCGSEYSACMSGCKG